MSHDHKLTPCGSSEDNLACGRNEQSEPPCRCHGPFFRDESSRTGTSEDSSVSTVASGNAENGRVPPSYNLQVVDGFEVLWYALSCPNRGKHLNLTQPWLVGGCLGLD